MKGISAANSASSAVASTFTLRARGGLDWHPEWVLIAAQWMTTSGFRRRNSFRTAAKSVKSSCGRVTPDLAARVREPDVDHDRGARKEPGEAEREQERRGGLGVAPFRQEPRHGGNEEERTDEIARP